MATPAAAPKMPPKAKTASAVKNGGERRSSRNRLEKNALEAALDDVYKEEEQEQQAASKAPAPVVHGHERAGGMDPTFAAALHDKLVDQGAETEAEPSGLRAPCTTCKLSPEELAKLADEDEDEGQAVHVHTQGAIDQVDSKLVTELQRKLVDQDRGDTNQKDDFAAALNKGLFAAVESGNAQAAPAAHGGIDSINDALVMNLQKKLGAVSGNEEDETSYYDAAAESQSGLRAPQCTVKLSAADLAAMDDDDEVMPGVELETKSHGAIDLVNSSLVTQLQQKLSDQTDSAEPVAPTGFRAPANTQKISAEMMNALDDDDEDEAAAAPAMPGMSVGVDAALVIELKRKLEDDHLEDPKDPSKIVKATGEPTVQLSADMLRALELADEEEEEEEQKKMEDLKNQLAQQGGMGREGGSDKAEHGFAADLAKSLAQVSGGSAPSSAEADLAAKLQQGLTQVVDTRQEESEGSGLKAPQCTEVITADMLAALDDEDEPATAEPGNSEGQIADAVSRLLGQEQTQERWSAVSGSDSGTVNKSSKPPKEKKKVNIGFRESNAGSEPAAMMDALAQKLSGAPSGDAPGGSSMAPADSETAVPRAPANTLMLSAAHMAALDDDEDIPMMDEPTLLPDATENVASGTKAPHSTTMLTSEQLAACCDDDEEDITEIPQVGMKAPHSTVVLSSDLLDQCDDDEDLMAGAVGVAEDSDPMPSGLKAPQTTAVLTAEQLAQFAAEDEDDEPVAPGMRAPQTTAVLTQDQLAMFADDDDEEQVAPSGLKAPHTTCMLRADDLAQLDDDVEEDTQENRALKEELQPAEDIATQVVQRVRDMPEAITDPWGNLPSVPVNSSCKLRLSWLSKDEIRKENDQLRKEIGQLKREIEAHRKAPLSQKA